MIDIFQPVRSGSGWEFEGNGDRAIRRAYGRIYVSSAPSSLVNAANPWEDNNSAPLDFVGNGTSKYFNFDSPSATTNGIALSDGNEYNYVVWCVYAGDNVINTQATLFTLGESSSDTDTESSSGI